MILNWKVRMPIIKIFTTLKRCRCKIFKYIFIMVLSLVKNNGTLLFGIIKTKIKATLSYFQQTRTNSFIIKVTSMYSSKRTYDYYMCIIIGR